MPGQHDAARHGYLRVLFIQNASRHQQKTKERMEKDKMIGYDETNAEELTPQQEAAVAMILDGKSDGEISERLKMRRQTVNEWRNHHTAFRMEVKLRREQTWETQQKKLSQLVCPVPGRSDTARRGYLRTLLLQCATNERLASTG